MHMLALSNDCCGSLDFKNSFDEHRKGGELKREMEEGERSGLEEKRGMWTKECRRFGSC